MEYIERKAQWNRNGIRIIYKMVRVTGKRQTGQTGQTARTGIPMKSSLTPPEEITAVAAAWSTFTWKTARSNDWRRKPRPRPEMQYLYVPVYGGWTTIRHFWMRESGWNTPWSEWESVAKENLNGSPGKKRWIPLRRNGSGSGILTVRVPVMSTMLPESAGFCGAIPWRSAYWTWMADSWIITILTVPPASARPPAWCMGLPAAATIQGTGGIPTWSSSGDIIRTRRNLTVWPCIHFWRRKRREFLSLWSIRERVIRSWNWRRSGFH